METAHIEEIIYQIARIFLYPVMTLILCAVVYSLISLGSFLMESLLRHKKSHISKIQHYINSSSVKLSTDDIELWIVKNLELLRIVSRTAPMLGLIATMIPMGPALLALSSGQTDQVGRNMVFAFSAVILALVAASISFFIMVIRRRWLLEELRNYEKFLAKSEGENALS